ncbi:MAG: LLM class F420-dependent oxidoreductase [Actinomycetota bacterium]|nr:LLM class F420-dependent oxidoreductase [Actinomycetota bacterium]
MTALEPSTVHESLDDRLDPDNRASASSVGPAKAAGNDRVRVGLQIQPQHAEWARIRDAAIEADEAGVDVVSTWDHFYPLFGEPEGKHFECWTILAAMAEVTTRCELTALVTCNSYRNPELLADMARTVDHISNGRLILGIGSGWFEKDYLEYGYEFGTAGERLTALADALPRIEARLGKLNPAPTRDIPLLIGGGGEKRTLRLVARHADIWHGFGDVETIARKHRILDEWCTKEGRDPSEIARSVSVKGDPAELAPPYLDAGTRLFVLSQSGPNYDVSALTDWLAWRDDVNG